MYPSRFFLRKLGPTNCVDTENGLITLSSVVKINPSVDINTKLAKPISNKLFEKTYL